MAKRPLPSPPANDLADLTAQRLRRLRQHLHEAAFDAVVLTTPESVLYATGYRSVPSAVFRSHRMAAIITADDMWLVCPASDTAPAADAGVPVDRLVPFGRFYFESTQATPLSAMADRHDDIYAALRTACGKAGPCLRYGVEDLPADARLAAVLPPTATDATGWALGLRTVKLPCEVDQLRYAARLAEVAVQRALDVAAGGITERELAAVVAATMVEGNAEPRFVVATTGERSALADAPPTDRAWRPGEIARFDVGCVYAGYWSDIGRTAVLGEPDTKQARRYAALLAGEQDQLDRAAPGVPASELFHTAIGTVQRLGVAPYRRQHCGHGIGLAIYEPPIVAPDAHTPLRQGMTFCFETPYYELGWGGMMVEDALVVTDDGIEMLTASPRDLRVVPA